MILYIFRKFYNFRRQISMSKIRCETQSADKIRGETKSADKIRSETKNPPPNLIIWSISSWWLLTVLFHMFNNVSITFDNKHMFYLMKSHFCVSWVFIIFG